MFPSPALIISSSRNFALRRSLRSTSPANKLDTSFLTTFSGTAPRNTTPAAKSSSTPNWFSAIPRGSPPNPNPDWDCLPTGSLKRLRSLAGNSASLRRYSLLPDAHHHRAVPWHLRRKLALKRTQVLVQPQVPDMHAAGKSNVLEIHFHGKCSRAAEQTDRHAAIGQRFCPNFQGTLR